MYKSSDITSWYQSLDPAVRDAAVRGLIGSAVGAGALGGVSAATSTGDHPAKRVVGNALMGALLGGVGAAGVPAGWNMITGKTRLPGEHSKPVISRGIDMLGQPFTTHPATTAGLGVGAYFGLKGREPLREAWDPAVRHVKIQDALEALKTQHVNVGGKFDPGALALEHAKAMPTSTSQKLRALVHMYTSPDAAMARGSQAKILEAAVPGAQDVGKARDALSAFKNKGVKGLYALPIALGSGWLLDRYLKGKY